MRDLLQHVVAGDYSREQLAELHKLTYVVGRQYVRMRCSGGRVPLSMFGLSEADVVHDCIADLFTRSPSGELVEIARYFEYRKVSPSSLPDDMLIVHLRNLVFTVVGDNLFRMLNESDPALGKIIRNIKLAVRKSGRWTIETRFDEKVLVLRRDDDRSVPGGAPAGGPGTLSPDQFEPAVNAALGRHRDIPSILEELARELVRSGPSAGPVPLLCLAVMLKVGFERAHTGGEAGEGSYEGESAEEEEELMRMISESCRSVDREMRPKYVGKGKVSDATFCRYIGALEMMFQGECIPPAGAAHFDDVSYFDALREVIPTLTKAGYAADHRSVFEYLGKQVKDSLRGKLDRR